MILIGINKGGKYSTKTKFSNFWGGVYATRNFSTIKIKTTLLRLNQFIRGCFHKAVFINIKNFKL